MCITATIFQYWIYTWIKKDNLWKFSYQISLRITTLQQNQGGGFLFYVNEELNCRSLEIYLPNTSKCVYYRSYSNYNKEQFEDVLKQRLVSSRNFEEFLNTFLAIWMSTPHWKRKKIDIIIKSLWVKHFLKLSWNDLS